MPPVKILLDTDVAGDCDDAGAIAVLHALADRGEAEILGMACDTVIEWGAPCIRAINAACGRPGLPVGTLKGPGIRNWPDTWEAESYSSPLAQAYLHAVQNDGETEDAVSLYRRLLAREGDGSVGVASIGFLTNLRDLLVSPPDSHSPLDGHALVARKVRELTVMGGRYPEGPPECNFAGDPDATREVVDRWPTPIAFAGSELGESVLTGPRLAAEQPPDHPVRRAYELWCNYFFPMWDPDGFLEDVIRPHSSYDQIAVLYAVRGLGAYWAARRGRNVVSEDGANEWQDDPEGRHSYLIAAMGDEELSAVIEELMVTAGTGKAS